MNFRCEVCGKDPSQFCTLCNVILCSGGCLEHHREKLPNAPHDLEAIQSRVLWLSIGSREFAARKQKSFLAYTFLSNLSKKLDKSLQTYVEQLDAAYTRCRSMMEKVHGAYNSMLHEVFNDLERPLVTQNYEFASQLTAVVYNYSGEVDANLPDLLSEVECVTHLLSFAKSTNPTDQRSRDTDLEQLRSKFQRAVGGTSAPSPEGEEHRLLALINKFLTAVYLPTFATPNAENTLRKRLPYRNRIESKSVATSAPIDIPLGMFIGQVDTGGQPDGLGAVIAKHNGSRAFPFHNGDLYVGQWSQGRIIGKGMMVFADGSLYEGMWENEEPSGTGSFVYMDGSHYEGELLRSQRHGEGQFTYCDGSKYSGNWRRGVREGWGVFTSERTQCAGEWVGDSLAVPGLQAGFYPTLTRQ